MCDRPPEILLQIRTRITPRQNRFSLNAISTVLERGPGQSGGNCRVIGNGWLGEPEIACPLPRVVGRLVTEVHKLRRLKFDLAHASELGICLEYPVATG